MIHERALKKLLIHSHRQAWCWQDEYYGLAMEDIRKLEAEAAEELKNRFAQLEEDDETLITLRSHLKSSERNGSIVGSSGSKKKKSSRDYGRRISMDRKDSLRYYHRDLFYFYLNDLNFSSACIEIKHNNLLRGFVTRSGFVWGTGL